MVSEWLPGGLLEPLGILKASWSGPGSLLGRPGKPLGRSWGGLGGLVGALGAVLEASWALLGVPWALLRRSWGHLEDQKAPKSEPGRVPNQAPQATGAENGETLIFDDST